MLLLLLLCCNIVMHKSKWRQRVNQNQILELTFQKFGKKQKGLQEIIIPFAISNAYDGTGRDAYI